MQPRQEPIAICRVEGDFDSVQYVTDIIRNEFLPHCSTSRLLKSDFKEGWLCFVNIYRITIKGPKVTELNLYAKPNRCAEEKEEAVHR
jgi:hypothetical protein